MIGGSVDCFPHLETFAGQKILTGCKVLVQKSEEVTLRQGRWRCSELGLGMVLGFDLVGFAFVRCCCFGLDPG